MRSKQVILLLIALSLFIWPGTASASLYDDITESLICPACLDDRMTVASCGDSTAEQAKEDIKAKLAAGQTKDQILAGYVAKYGDIILTVPSKSGFNIMAWVIPPLATIAGTLLVYFVVTRWARNHQGRQRFRGDSMVLDEVDENRIQEEIRKYL
ncbi:MAG: cytochrome c-type biogenesis protein CcmH [Firmicutes bacterium]|nr:cytochrome c-type biogenesis protein CcmH [Bacillota bacterium]